MRCRKKIIYIFWFFLSGMGFSLQAQEKFEIPNGSTVAFHYTLIVDGKVIDSSIGKTPQKYIQGAGQIVSGLEEELKHIKPHTEKWVTVRPEKGYGIVNPEMFQTVAKKTFKNRSKIKQGSVVTGEFEGSLVRATVVGQDEEKFFLNLNHPLAGKTLQFKVEIIDVKSSIQPH